MTKKPKRMQRYAPRHHVVLSYGSTGWLVDAAEVWSYDTRRERTYYVAMRDKDGNSATITFSVRR